MSILGKLREEPIRAVVLPVAGLAIALALAKGIIDDDTATMVTTIVGAILGVGAAEKVRTQVTPMERVKPVVREVATKAAIEAEAELRQHLADDPATMETVMETVDQVVSNLNQMTRKTGGL